MTEWHHQPAHQRPSRLPYWTPESPTAATARTSMWQKAKNILTKPLLVGVLVIFSIAAFCRSSNLQADPVQNDAARLPKMAFQEFKELVDTLDRTEWSGQNGDFELFGTYRTGQKSGWATSKVKISGTYSALKAFQEKVPICTNWIYDKEETVKARAAADKVTAGSGVNVQELKKCAPDSYGISTNKCNFVTGAKYELMELTDAHRSGGITQGEIIIFFDCDLKAANEVNYQPNEGPSQTLEPAPFVNKMKAASSENVRGIVHLSKEKLGINFRAKFNTDALKAQWIADRKKGGFTQTAADTYFEDSKSGAQMSLTSFKTNKAGSDNRYAVYLAADMNRSA